MKFVLMHRNTTVAAVKIDEITGVIYAIGEIYDSGHLPLGTNVKDGSIDRAKLNDWWRERCIRIRGRAFEASWKSFNVRL